MLLQLEDYTCCICLSLLVDPITLHCQHSYCRHCLVSCFELSAKRCPACRTPSDPRLAIEQLQSNTLLINLLKLAWPQRYARREQSVREVRDSWKHKFAVYYSHELVFPDQSLLVNMTEPRYKVMLHRLAQGSSPHSRSFALLPHQQPSAGGVGVICEVLGECLSDSGAVQVMARHRFVIASAWVEDGTHGLHYVRVELVDDIDESSSEHSAQVTAAVSRLHSLIAAYSDVSPVSFYSKHGSIPASPLALSFWIFQALAVDSALGGVDQWLANEVLSSRSLLWRLDVGEDLLRDAIAAMQQQMHMQEDYVSSRRAIAAAAAAHSSLCPYAASYYDSSSVPPPASSACFQRRPLSLRGLLRAASSLLHPCARRRCCVCCGWRRTGRQRATTAAADAERRLQEQRRSRLAAQQQQTAAQTAPAATAAAAPASLPSPAAAAAAGHAARTLSSAATAGVPLPAAVYC